MANRRTRTNAPSSASRARRCLILLALGTVVGATLQTFTADASAYSCLGRGYEHRRFRLVSAAFADTGEALPPEIHWPEYFGLRAEPSFVLELPELGEVIFHLESEPESGSGPLPYSSAILVPDDGVQACAQAEDGAP